MIFFCRQLGADAAERAKIVGEFIQRKKDAEMNKKRGKAELFGVCIKFCHGLVKTIRYWMWYMTSYVIFLKLV